MMMNLHWPFPKGRDPSIPKPHCWKGQGLVIDVKGSDGRREILACSWQILHFLTRLVASLSIVGQ